MVERQSWKNNFRDAFKDSTSLFSFLGWKSSSAWEVEKHFSVFIPLNLAKKIKLQGPNGVLAREFIPDSKELNTTGMIDPIGDKEYSVAPQLIHRYLSRALFTPTSICPVHCRYCFRRNELNPQDELFSGDFHKTLAYLNAHPEISEIIFTGGDPLTLSNEKLRFYLEAFSQIKSIRDIRFHTRYPVILPERLDEGLATLLNDFSSIFRTINLAIHANHVDEFDEISVNKIIEFSKLNIQLLSQTVLLKGVNDNIEDLFETAIREFIEETGIQPFAPYIDLENITQKSGKIVFAWAFELDFDFKKGFKSNSIEIEWPPKSGKKITIPEIDKLEYFTIEEAMVKINLAQTKLIQNLIGRI